MAKNPKPREVGSKPLVIEVTEPMLKMLTGLQNTGCFGPSVETAAQRILEMWILDYVTSTTEEFDIAGGKE